MHDPCWASGCSVSELSPSFPNLCPVGLWINFNFNWGSSTEVPLRALKNRPRWQSRCLNYMPSNFPTYLEANTIMPVCSFSQTLDVLSLPSFSDLPPSYRFTVVSHTSLLTVLDTIHLIVKSRVEFWCCNLIFWLSLLSVKTPKPLSSTKQVLLTNWMFKPNRVL